MARAQPPPTRFRRREDTRHQVRTEDPYLAAKKPAQPVGCPRCGLEYRDGRWRRPQGKAAPGDRLCPACRRTLGHEPAGEVRLSGPFLAAHREDILATLRGTAEHEGAEHPLERIAEVREEGADLVVTTTGVHLARAMGQALRRAWDGVLRIEDEDAVRRVRVRWER